MYSIGFANMDMLPEQNRIKDLYREYYELLKVSHSVNLLPKYDNVSPKTDYLKLIQTVAEDYDVLFGYDRNFLQARKLMNRKIPVILPLFADMTLGGMTLWINKNLLRTNDTLLFSCTSDYDIYKKVCVSSTIQTKVLPLPINKMFEYYAISDRRYTPNRALSLLYVGRLTRSKNIHGLIELCKELKGHMNFQLNLVGTWDYYHDGREYKKYIKRLIEQHGLMDSVSFKGYLDGCQLIEEYKNADVFVNLTLNKDENFGLVQVEAMSQGLPIVCSDWGGLKDHVIQGLNGYKVKTRYSDGCIRVDLAEAVEYICRLHDIHTRMYMSKNARSFFSKVYSRDIIEKQFELLINNMVDSENEPAKIVFSDEAQDFCMKRILASVKHCSIDSDFKFLKMYASDIQEGI